MILKTGISLNIILCINNNNVSIMSSGVNTEEGGGGLGSSPSKGQKQL